EEGRRKKEEGRRKKEKGKRKKEEGKRFSVIKKFLTVLAVAIFYFRLTQKAWFASRNVEKKNEESAQKAGF
ncbi:MAG: hypothetical protein LH628_26075, partial [Microcoleus sp. CAN_BIN18]|nr:hypothetical protein [Microcoleus sp. CAN_BIN18]